MHKDMCLVISLQPECHIRARDISIFLYTNNIGNVPDYFSPEKMALRKKSTMFTLFSIREYPVPPLLFLLTNPAAQHHQGVQTCLNIR
jgi:hypothetical protein